MNFIGSENLRTTTRTPSFVFAGAWDLHCAVALLSLFPCVWEFCLLNGVVSSPRLYATIFFFPAIAVH